MKGKAKLVRKGNGAYFLYTKTYPWQRWKPCNYIDTPAQMYFNTFEEFIKKAKVETFNEITITLHKRTK